MLETWKKCVIPCSSTNLLGMPLILPNTTPCRDVNAAVLAQEVWAPHRHGTCA